MSAKSELISRLEYLGDAIANPVVIDIGISTSTHNGIAALLRKGLGIVAFNIIEDYIKDRAEEGLLFISSSGVLFRNLTDKLKKSATSGALKSLLSNLSRLQKDPAFDTTAFLQAEAYNIYSTSIHPFKISKYSLVSSNSNVLADEISELLKSFGIDNCWPRLKTISDGIGGGIPDLAGAFANASQRRHNAAHDAAFNYTHSWLTNIKSEILAIAASIDIALTAKCRQITRSPTSSIAATDISTDLNYRFLEVVSPTLVREKKNILGKSIKNWPDIPTAVAAISPKLNNRKEFLIVLNSSGRITDWHT